MKDQIITQLLKANADFSEPGEYDLTISTKYEEVNVHAEIHWLGKSRLIQKHHLDLYGKSISETGYRSHFISMAPDEELTIEDFAEGLEAVIEKRQEEYEPIFQQQKIEEIKKTQLSLF